jgi:FkbM family methyltransferase
LIRDPHFRRDWEHRAEVERLKRVPRNTTMTTNLVGGCFELVDSQSFLAQYRAIFEQQIYRFDSRKEMPLIIDGGANVGLSVLFFKRLYPKSRILAFEPDPALFQVLAKNCAAHCLEDVQLIRKALWTEEAVVKFDRDEADDGRIVAQTHSLYATDICACRLKDYLNQEIDLLKLDLEGAELAVLQDCEDGLGNVEKIVVEYHSYRNQPQKLHLLARILHDAGFRLHVNASLVSPQPLWWRQVSNGMDMRLRLYGFRR